MKKRISLKKVLIITLIAVLVIGGGLISFFIIKDKLFSSESSILVNGEQLAELSNENYTCFDEGFTDIKVTDEKSALEAVASVSDAIGINDAEKELKVNSIDSLDGDTFYRIQQYYNDIPVYGKDVVLVSDENGLAISLTANSIDMKKGLMGKNIDTDFDNEKGVDAIEEYFGEVYSVEDKGPYYMAFDSNQIKLTHLYNVLAKVNEETVNFEVSVSYSDYKVVFTNDLVNTNNEDYSYKVSDNKYYMFDEKRNIVMLNSNRGLAKTLYCDDGIHIVDSAGIIDDEMSDEAEENAYNIFLDNNDEIKNDISDKFSTHVYSPIEYVTSNNNKWDKNAVKFMNYVEKSYDYYKEKFNRKGYDNENGEMFVTYNDKFDSGNNAYSNGNSLCFGYNKSSSTVDLVAHEFTHSVEGSISGMIYEGESGALMEAYSDIFGELVENYANGKCDWIHDNGRSLKNPSKSKKNGSTVAYPKKYKDKNWTSTTNLNDDNGGVHKNSTVISHTAYLMNNGINGDEKMKIDTELLAKIWYKSLFLLHPNATLKQCADAVYNAALITDGVTFDQRVCIRTAFGEAGLDVKSIIAYNVHNGTTIYAISKDNKKYVNYHIKVTDYNTKEVVDEKDITNDKGYKLDLDNGKYILSLTDNDEKGSKSTFYKTIYLREIPNKKVNSYINILTDFYFDYDAQLNEKLSELIDKYGIASDETYTTNLDLIGSSSWTNREGLVSAKLSDLDCDGINELVVVRLIGGELTSDAENIEIQVYYYTNDGVKSAGSLKFFTGDDLKEKQIDSFIYKIRDKKYIFVESDFTMSATEGTSNVSYYVLEYTAGKLSKKKYLYLETKFDAFISYKWTEVTWNGDVKKEKEIYYYDYEKNIKRGTYKDSDNPIKDYFVDFGLTETNDCFDLPRITRFFNIKKSEKLFEIKQNRDQNNYSQCHSSLKDYTGLDHSKATTTAEKVPEWKEQYINFLEKEKIYTNASFGFSIVDIDENGIPELITTGFAAAGTQMIWIKDGEVVNQPIGYGELKYIPSDNLIYCSYLNYGIYNDYVYSFDNQDLNAVFTGTILPEENGFKKHGWFIGDLDNSVSESEYKQALNKAFDFDSAKGLDSCPSGSGEQIIQMIKAY